MANRIIAKLSKLQTALRARAIDAVRDGDVPKTLLSTNPKTIKSETVEVATWILHLAPAFLSGVNVCLWASAGCIAACLNTAGHGGMMREFTAGVDVRSLARTQYARIRRTVWLLLDKPAFLARLRKDIERCVRRADKLGKLPAFRLNGTSDLDWLDIIREYPNVQFYDYTKSVERIRAFTSGKLPANYHLTYSRSEDTDICTIRDITWSGGNVAVVFADKLPNRWHGIRVINGDAHDARFLDPRGVIVGLVAKGAARGIGGQLPNSGFVVTP